MSAPTPPTSIAHACVELSNEQLELLADLVAERLRGPSRSRLLDARAVADHLGVDPGWVYEHADELGVRRLGAGPKARLRFILEDVDRAVACSASRQSQEAASSAGKPGQPRRRTSRSGTGVPLLPIRGPEVDLSARWRPC